MTQAQSYEAWRITYQSAEQAARNAFNTAEMLRQELLAARAAIPGPAHPAEGVPAQGVQPATKNMKVPSVTPANVEAVIDSEHYYTGQIAAETEGQHRALGGIMNCTLVMKNGHLVTGEALLQDLSKPDPERAKASARRRAFAPSTKLTTWWSMPNVTALPPPSQQRECQRRTW